MLYRERLQSTVTVALKYDQHKRNDIIGKINISLFRYFKRSITEM